MQSDTGWGPSRRRLEDDLNGDADGLPPGTVRSLRGLASELDDHRDGIYRRLDRYNAESRERDAEIRTTLQAIEAKIIERGRYGLQTATTVAVMIGCTAVGSLVTYLVTHLP